MLLSILHLLVFLIKLLLFTYFFVSTNSASGRNVLPIKPIIYISFPSASSRSIQPTRHCARSGVCRCVSVQIFCYYLSANSKGVCLEYLAIWNITGFCKTLKHSYVGKSCNQSLFYVFKVNVLLNIPPWLQTYDVTYGTLQTVLNDFFQHEVKNIIISKGKR